MLDHTITRIVKAHPNAFSQVTLDDDKYENLTLLSKWGCEGSSGHATYRQSFIDPQPKMPDEPVFFICIVPSKVKIGEVKSSLIINCSPLKIMFAKESTDFLRA